MGSHVPHGNEDGEEAEGTRELKGHEMIFHGELVVCFEFVLFNVSFDLLDLILDFCFCGAVGKKGDVEIGSVINNNVAIRSQKMK